MFALIPAIDLVDGRLGIYTPEGPRPLDAFGGDPLAAARSFAAAGARWLHVVDLDLAYGRASDNLAVVGAIARAHPDLRLQCSGGVRDDGAVGTLLEAGASRVVVSSAALLDEGSTAAMITARGQAVIMGIELSDGRIRARGDEHVDLDLMTSLGWLVAVGAHAFLVTGVSRVGTGRGPDVDGVRRVARSGRTTLAAGGIATIDDLQALRRAGAAGAVVGHAAATGSLDLVQALDWAARY
jgi:phosphoribosylformimino-5-aminoimidazole carboxamide ribonucleotide (ProFAR) isomerase